MEAFTQILNIEMKFATHYYKTTQGLVERLNKVMKDLQHPYIRTDGKFWDKKIKFFTFAHNKIRNQIIGFSPAPQFFGRNLHGPRCSSRKSD